MILAVDQGTTGTTCLVVDDELEVVGRGYQRVTQHYPRPGWVEHDPEELVLSVEKAAVAALADAAISADELDCVGIANQRETAVVWDRRTGRPLHRAIVWQDRRTADRCRELPADLIRERTGLVPDPYFAATKLEWLLREIDRDAAELACGTVDTWLAWKLTRGGAYVTDVSNASRTLLLDVRTRLWDDELLALFGLERALLPDVVSSAGVVGEVELAGSRLPLAALAGDQQAALVGQACFRAGQAKATYGTGGFLLANAGSDAEDPPHGLLLTVAAQTGDEPADYALEGSILAAGAVLDWMASGLGLIDSPGDTEVLARSVDGTDGVHVVPALAGLGSPYWASGARGTITGLTQGTGRAHVVRAALEAIAYRTRDIFDRIPFEVTTLRVDGGVSDNRFAMQFLADVLGIPVELAAEREATAVGAAALAGIATGVWAGPEAVAARWRSSTRCEPSLGRDEADSLYASWTEAVQRAL